MKNVIRSEALRAASGHSLLAVYLVAVLMPLFVLVSDGSRFEFGGFDAGAVTTRLVEPLAWCAVSAAFIGAYGVTRECYYGSMDRTLAGVGFSRAFVAKSVAGVLVAVALCLCVFVVWTLGVATVLAQNGRALVLTDEAWAIYAGTLVGAVLGAVIGAAIGWISRNYYVTAAIVLVIPMVVEFALLRTAPEIARFSPGMILAALGVPGYQDQLLDFAPALGFALVWCVGVVAVAWLRGRRRIR